MLKARKTGRKEERGRREEEGGKKEEKERKEGKHYWGKGEEDQRVERR